MRARLKENQEMLLRAIAVRYDVSIDEAIAILFQGLKNAELREELQKIIRYIEREGMKKSNRMIDIWITDAENYRVLRKIGRLYRKPVWYVLDILISSIKQDVSTFRETFKLIDVAL